MLTCTQCAEILPDLLEGQGDPALRQSLLEQAAGRERCQHCVDTYKQCAELTGQAYAETRPPELCEHLLAYLREHLQPPPPPPER
jgi:hypothetical protein